MPAPGHTWPQAMSAARWVKPGGTPGGKEWKFQNGGLDARRDGRAQMASITPAIVLQRHEMKKTNEIMKTTAPRREPVRVKLQRVNVGFSETHTPDGEGAIWWARLKEALGTTSNDFVNASLFQLQRAIVEQPDFKI